MVLLASDLGSENRAGALSHKSEILVLLDRGALKSFGVAPDSTHAEMLAKLGRTISQQLRRALEKDDRGSLSSVLEIMETVT